MKRTARVLGLVALALLGACASDDGAAPGQSATSRSALDSAFRRPVPARKGLETWLGSEADLLIADALASCAWVDDDKQPLPDDRFGTEDSMLARILGYMSSARWVDGTTSCDSPSASVIEDWFSLRAKYECNKAPGTDATPARALLEKHPIGMNVIALDPYSGEFPVTGVADANTNASRALSRPSQNLCVAQELRALIAGSSLGDARFLPATEIRKLNDAGRRLSAQSVIEFAKLAEVFTATLTQTDNAVTPQNGMNRAQFLLAIRKSAVKGMVPLDRLGRDFAAAIDLLTYFTDDALSFYARDGAAKTLAGQQGFWGPMSWSQRASASLFGGEPLATRLVPQGVCLPGSCGKPSDAPWSTHHPNLAQIDPLGGSAASGFSWPTHQEQPWVRERMTPGARTLLSLASSLDQLKLPLVDAPPHEDRFEAYHQTKTLLYQIRAGRLSANELYNRVERAINPTAYLPMEPDTAGPDGPAYEPYALWQRYRVTPADALVAVSVVSDQLGSIAYEGGVVHLGADVDGKLTIGYDALTGAQRLHITRGTVLVPRDPSVVATTFGRNAFMPLYRVYSWFGDASDFGFPNVFSASTRVRDGEAAVGSVSALAAARMAILDALRALSTPTTLSVAEPIDFAAPMFDNASRMLDVINSAIGDGGATFVPVARSTTATFQTSAPAKAQFASSGTDRADWRVTFVGSASDGFWPASAGSSEWGKIKLQIVHGKPLAGNLARRPNASLFGKAMPPDKRVIDVFPISPQPDAINPDSLRTYPIGNRLVVAGTAAVSLGTTLRASHWTIIAEKEIAQNDGSKRFERRVLLDGYRALLKGKPEYGAYAATGGAFGEKHARDQVRDDLDPAEPYYDPFGIPRRWAPPSNTDLYKGAGDGTPVSYYLERAGKSASEASDALAKAASKMINEEADDTARRINAARSIHAQKEALAALCGPAAGSSCDTTLGTVDGRKLTRPEDYGPWFHPQYYSGGRCEPFMEQPPVYIRPHLCNLVTPRGACLPDPYACSGTPIVPRSKPHAVLDNVGLTVHQALHALRLPLASAVVGQIDAPAPDFSAYAGGALQQSFLRQWRAIGRLRESYDLFRAAVDEAHAAYDAAIASDAVSNAALQKCIDDNQSWLEEVFVAIGAVFGAIASVFATVATAGAGGAAAAAVWASALSTAGASTSAGIATGHAASAAHTALSDEEIAEECAVEIKNVDASKAASVAELVASRGKITQAAHAISEGLYELAQAVAEMQRLRHEAELTRARAQLEEELANQSLTTMNGTYRRFTHYDLWRAHALTESARRSGVLARRALDAHYVEDLSRLSMEMPTVASPATWADSIYGYDYTLAPTVGTMTASSEGGWGVTDQVVDYVGNLQRFLDSYPIIKPSSLAHDDSAILWLDGPNVALDIGQPSAPQAPAKAPTISAFSWSFVCDEGSPSLPDNGPGPTADPDTHCAGKRPTRARVTFALDPWGQLVGAAGNKAFGQRFNTRWEALSVNLVGTAVVDCTASPTTQCYTKPFVDAHLTHTGPSWIDGHDGKLIPLGAGSANIEGLQALATEEVLSAVGNGWTNPLAQDVQRFELSGRPVGGVYTLELELPETVRVERIEGVQILMRTRYWVRQTH